MKKKRTPPITDGTHEHNWKTGYVETRNGATITSYLRCTSPNCDYEESWRGRGWKVVEGSFEKQHEPMLVINSKY